MAHLGPEMREITDGLDALGNTTAAIGKGFAIGSAALTALALFAAYTETVGHRPSIDLTSSRRGHRPLPRRHRAVPDRRPDHEGRRARRPSGMVEEVRRQFREIPGLMEGDGAKPDTRALRGHRHQGARSGR